jgi:hypothetical protein
MVPLDLSSSAISSWVPAGSGFTQYTGSGSASGALNLGSAPSGNKWIVVQMGADLPVYLWTDASATQLDLGTTVLGRPNAATAMAPTWVTLNVGSMDSWTSGDDLEWYSPNLGQWHEPLLDFSSVVNAPLAGSTSLSGLSFDWSTSFDTRLIDGAKGDQLYFTRFTSHTVGSGSALGLSQTFQPAAFTMQSGTPITLSGSFAAVPQTGSVSFIWDGTAYSALAAQVAKGSYLWADYSLLDLQPGGMSHGPAYPNPDVFYAEFLGTTTTPVGPYSFGNPYPASWPMVFSVLVYYRAPIVAPGATHASGVLLLCSRDSIGAPASGSTVSPVLGPVQAPTINGLDALNATSGVGTSPTLAWSQPSLGTATDYVVTVLQVGNNSGYTMSTKIANLYTTNTQMTIPPGVLSAGQTYAFVIRALHRPGVDATQHPFRHTFDEAVCDSLTAFTTP